MSFDQGLDRAPESLKGLQTWPIESGEPGRPVDARLESRHTTQRSLPLLFATTLFVSASLLFLVQPMLAKMVLPMLGGTPSVWNTCMVFFQTMLLAGYLYAHWVGTRLRLRTQIIVHVGLLLLAALALPISLSQWALRALPSGEDPSAWLLGCLFLSAGLPFFAVATNGPLLQRWFSQSRHSSARDPYFLYAASNLGSLLALFAYPLLLEPFMLLGRQSGLWTAGFIALIGLILTCGVLLLWTRRLRPDPADPAAPADAGFNAPEHPSAAPVSFRQRWRWCILAFVPSSLMLGVTTYLTTDIASIPLLWILPLSIYLLTFVLVFARNGDTRWRWMARALPIGVLGLAYMLLSEATQPVWALITLHLLVFFLAAMVCHGQLAADRPAAVHLTEFYIWIAVGGMLGGMFNALAAPMLFSRVIEYPMALVLACWLTPQLVPRKETRPSVVLGLDLAVPAAVGSLAALLASLVLPWSELSLQMRLGIAFGLPLMACYGAVDRPARFALALGAVMLVSSFFPGIHGKPLHLERNFYGVLRVTRDPVGPFVRLVHGNTIHGRQSTDSAQRCEPLSYYHRTGPLGRVIDVFRAGKAAANVAAVGLGAGSMACYARVSERWTFYEINPAVVRIAMDTNYFTLMSDCAAGPVQVVLGDARLRLKEAPAHHYGLIVLDAFSSDSIPLHLITREALQLYVSKLAPGGMLAFHISNRTLDLENVLGDLAADARLVCHSYEELDVRPFESAEGKDPSHWLVMARQKEDLGAVVKDGRWLPIRGRPNARVWTDDFSNIISVFHWD